MNSLRFKFVANVVLLWVMAVANLHATLPVDRVYPFLDTENSRWFFFSSACRPFGMVNLSPDTETGGAWGSGYLYKTEEVKGFSHIHAWQLSGVSVMPVTFEKEQSGEVLAGSESAFSHSDEIAGPGYHRLHLQRYGIDVELTATQRVGMHRYHFPEKANAGVVLSLSGLLGPSMLSHGSLAQISEYELRGEVVNEPTIRRPKATKVFFVIQLSRPILELQLQGEDVVEKALIHLDNSSPDPVLMKVGISYTSTENAAKNIELELPHWEFDTVVAEAKSEWNDHLSRIEVVSDDEQAVNRFYTDLWHALQGRRTISDAEGYYPDYTRNVFRIGRVAIGEDGKPLYRHFNSDSFWGAQWTLDTLWHLVYPEISDEFVNSLLHYYQDGGLIPRGPSGGNYTYVMTGASTTPFIVSAWMKGIRGYDASLAYEGCRKNHLPDGIMSKAGYEHDTILGGGLHHYIRNGWVPFPIPEGDEFGFHQDGASLTLEYAYQDWCLAQFAKELDQLDDYDYFLKRSENFRNVIDPNVGWARPKDVDGNWKDPYDPFQYKNGFIEGNGAQHTWFVPHNPKGLADALGGIEVALSRLEWALEESEKSGFTSGTSHAAERHPEYRRIPINYGNQPSIHTAFLFAEFGRPDLTQLWSRRIVDRVYSTLDPQSGYNGDEDQGLMGSLAVLMKMGLFEVDGGASSHPSYWIGSAIFDQITIHLNQEYYPGSQIEIHTENQNKNAAKVESVSWNRKEIEGMKIAHEELVKGGVLKLVMEVSQP